MTNQELVYVSAVRYGLGRKTYMPSVISDFIISEMDKLTTHCKRTMIKEIQEAWNDERLGNKCDEKTWLDFLDKLKDNNINVYQKYDK